MRRLIYSMVLAGALTAGWLTMPSPAAAYANTPPIDSSYNSRIIDDSVMLNKDTMTVADIQAFLNSKVPVCDTNHQGGLPQYPPPYTCLKDYVDPTVNKSSAQIIYDMAQARGLNPQVILTILQKEQGLVTDTWPYPSQYRAAMGYGCPEAQSVCDSTYYGLYHQIDWGVSMLRARTARSCRDSTVLPAWSDIPDELKVGNTTDPATAGRVDGVATLIGSCATGAMYYYTPHRPDSAYTLRNGSYYYGNYNFVTYFNSWFGSTWGSPLYQSRTDSKIYAIANGFKYYIPDYQTMVAYGFHRLAVNLVDQTMIDGFPVDPDPANRTLTTVAHQAGDPSGITYLFDDGKRYAIDGSACAKNLDGSVNPTTTWGIDCFNTAVNKALPVPFFTQYTVYDGPIPPMMAFQNTVYKLEGGNKRPIMDSVFIDVLGGWAKVRWMKDINAMQPLGKPLLVDNQLITFAGSPQVYLYDNAKLSPVNDINVYLAWGFASRQSRQLPAAYNQGGAALPTAAGLTVFAQDSSGSTYLVDQGNKRPLGSLAAQWPVGTPVTDAPHALAGLPTTALPGVLSSAGGTIFTVWGSKKFVFPTFDDFFGLGFSLNMVGTVSPYTEGLFSGAFGGFHLAPGRLYKVSGADVVYLVNGASSLVVPSPNYFAYFDLPTTKTLTVDATTAARYPSAGMLPLAFKNGAGAVYIADGVKRVVSASMQTQYGLTVSSLTTLTDVAVSRLPDGAAATQFAKISNGQIFYITGGQRKYITTPATLVSLGANAGNIVNEPDEFILAMPDGGSL